MSFTHPQLGPQQPHYDVNAKLAEFDTVPLFMKSLPPEDASNGSDVALEALKSLAHAGTPDEQAFNFKEQGNDYYKAKRYREALAFYTQGLNAQPENTNLKENLLSNRAACNLELKNFGSVLRDTSVALQVNPVSSKAYYRSALALVNLERYEEAIDCCDRCLAFDISNASVKSLRDKATQLKGENDRKEAEARERQRKEREERRIMGAAFQALNLIVVPPKAGERTTYAPHFDPLFSGLRTSATPVLFPVFFLYPQHNQSDYIQSFDPSATFGSHLYTMFPGPSLVGGRSGSSSSTPFSSLPTTPTNENDQPPPSWDINRQYTASNLAVYVLTHRRRLLKIGRRMTLRDACDAAAAGNANLVHDERDGLRLEDGCLTFYIMPKGEFEQSWVEETKQRKDSSWFR